jgi:hypothetical protein
MPPPKRRREKLSNGFFILSIMPAFEPLGLHILALIPG